ncbi:unannotated protein [freshwater metagenome]|uniref:Unannotated protein n=1 Tax=freshwater metagenome TaxID=449393 RepID=A0A6J6U8U0_9ZZZZ
MVHTNPFVKSRIALAASLLLLSASLSSCGVQIDNGCILIKKQSEERRQLGASLLEMADAGKVDEGLTVEDVQAQGYKYIIEGTQWVVDNPQCFTEDEVRIAKNLLGQ